MPVKPAGEDVPKGAIRIDEGVGGSLSRDGKKKNAQPDEKRRFYINKSGEKVYVK